MTDGAEVVVAESTVSDRDWAERAARELVEQSLAACVNIHGPLHSTYRWEGSIETAEEWGLAIKTVRDRIPDIEAWMEREHPYRVFELMVHPVRGGNGEYLDWVRQNASRGNQEEVS